VLKQIGDGFVNRFGINHVVVVKDKDKSSVREVISFIKAVKIDSVDGGIGDWSAANTPVPRFRRNRLQSSYEVSQKACCVFIPFIE